MLTLIVVAIVFIVICLFVMSALFRKLFAEGRPTDGHDNPAAELADKLDSSGMSDDAKRQLLEQMDPETAADKAEQSNADAAVARDSAHLDPKPTSGPVPQA